MKNKALKSLLAYSLVESSIGKYVVYNHRMLFFNTILRKRNEFESFFLLLLLDGLQCNLCEHSNGNAIFSLTVLKNPQSIQRTSQQNLKFKLKTSVSTKKKLLTEVSHVRSFTHIYIPNHRRPTELNCALLFNCSSIC